MQIARIIRAFAAEPLVVGRALPGEYRQRHGHAQYAESDIDTAWYEHLHQLLGVPWPCPMRDRLAELLADISDLLIAQGLGTGRRTYGWYSDAESSLCHAVWCTAVHNKPQVVVETGVAHGVASRIILEALQLHGEGRLWSIDLPHPLDRRLHPQTGAAVTEPCHERWSYLKGTSRQRMPKLMTDVGHVDMFIHDSLHTATNTLFEMEQAASVMPAGGVMLVDDMGAHDAFATFARRHRDFETIVCPAEDGMGQFGIAVRIPG